MVTDPNLAVLLIAAGVLAIYVELCRPGWVAPGVIGGVAFTVGTASLLRMSASPALPFVLALLVPLGVLSAFLGTVAIRARRNKRS